LAGPEVHQAGQAVRQAVRWSPRLKVAAKAGAVPEDKAEKAAVVAP
jgi:hypothetical protein